MRAPEFWDAGRGGAAALALTPLGFAYGLATRLRLWAARAWRAPVPVLCVGNLVAGGAGKTPVALSLGRRLQAKGRRVHFVTRGYGGTLAGPVRVEPGRHGAREVGDEALLLARWAPTWVARHRLAGGAAAVRAGAQMLILDDGYQDGRLAHDVSLVVVDGAFGFGNGRLIPAGPLREPIARGLARADAVVLLGGDESGVARLIPPGVPLLQARLAPDAEAARLAGRRAVAFAGIGRPRKFFRTLAEAGVSVVAERPFPDHHPFRPRDLERLREEAKAKDAILVTTEKDFVRLDAGDRRDVVALAVDVGWEDEAAVDAALAPLLNGR